jgi:membrane protein required for colicin V production
MIDLLLLAVIGVSALLGLMKGFVGIVVGTLSWLLSGWATFLFGDTAAHWLAEGAQPSMTNYLGGYALVFVGVMVLVAMIGMALRSVIQATRLTGTDRRYEEGARELLVAGTTPEVTHAFDAAMGPAVPEADDLRNR